MHEPQAEKEAMRCWLVALLTTVFAVSTPSPLNLADLLEVMRLLPDPPAFTNEPPLVGSGEGKRVQPDEHVDALIREVTINETALRMHLEELRHVNITAEYLNPRSGFSLCGILAGHIGHIMRRYKAKSHVDEADKEIFEDDVDDGGDREVFNRALAARLPASTPRVASTVSRCRALHPPKSAAAEPLLGAS